MNYRHREVLVRPLHQQYVVCNVDSWPLAPAAAPCLPCWTVCLVLGTKVTVLHLIFDHSNEKRN